MPARPARKSKGRGVNVGRPLEPGEVFPVDAISQAIYMSPQVERIYGALHGVRGIIDEDFIDLTQETSHNLELVAGTPSSALGSTRDKPDAEYCKKIFKVLQAHEIEHFFYIGGNDSSDTVRIVTAK